MKELIEKVLIPSKIDFEIGSNIIYSTGSNTFNIYILL
jgi:hypothetical protein